MRRLRVFSLWRTILLWGALVPWLAGCHKWVSVEPPGPMLRDAAESGHSRTYRIYLPNDTVIEGQPTGLSGDSLVIRTEGSSVTLAEADIDRAQLRSVKVLATVLLIVGVAVAPFLIYGVALGIACSGQGEKCLS
jgi:hypothetical protein